MSDADWVICAYFENYEINALGQIRHARSKEIKRPSLNQYGIPYVSLWDLNLRRKVNKPVATVLAETFLEKNSPDDDTIIYLNADKQDLRLDNLKWRTRAFAINYHRQITTREGKEFVDHTFECIETGEQHHSTYQVAMSEGVLPSAIFSSVLNNDQWYEEDKPWTKWQVPPTGKSYRSVGRYSFKDRTGL